MKITRRLSFDTSRGLMPSCLKQRRTRRSRNQDDKSTILKMAQTGWRLIRYKFIHIPHGHSQKIKQSVLSARETSFFCINRHTWQHEFGSINFAQSFQSKSELDLRHSADHHDSPAHLIEPEGKEYFSIQKRLPRLPRLSHVGLNISSNNLS